MSWSSERNNFWICFLFWEKISLEVMVIAALSWLRHFPARFWGYKARLHWWYVSASFWAGFTSVSSDLRLLDQVDWGQRTGSREDSSTLPIACPSLSTSAFTDFFDGTGIGHGLPKGIRHSWSAVRRLDTKGYWVSFLLQWFRIYHLPGPAAAGQSSYSEIESEVWYFLSQCHPLHEREMCAHSLF